MFLASSYRQEVFKLCQELFPFSRISELENQIMIFLNTDEDHRLLPAAPAVAVSVLRDVTHQRLDGLDADRPEFVTLTVEQVERLIRPKFNLHFKNKSY